MKKNEYSNLSNFLNKIKDTLAKYNYEYSTSFKRTCNDDFYSFSVLNFGTDKFSSVYVSGNVRTGYLSIEYDTMVYSFLPSGKHSFSVNTARYKVEDKETAMEIETFRKIENPSLTLFKKECFNYLKRIKELKLQLKELKIKQDF